MQSSLTSLADRLKAKLNGATDQNLLVEDQELVELMDAQLYKISAAHGSGHNSHHPSSHDSSPPPIL